MASAHSAKPRRPRKRAVVSKSAKRHRRALDPSRHRGSEPGWIGAEWPILMLAEVLEFIRVTNPRAARRLAAVLATAVAIAATTTIIWLLLRALSV